MSNIQKEIITLCPKATKKGFSTVGLSDITLAKIDAVKERYEEQLHTKLHRRQLVDILVNNEFNKFFEVER